MSTATGDDAGTETGAADGGHERFTNAVVTVPVDGLGDFYKAVADWWERYEEVRGRAMRGRPD